MNSVLKPLAIFILSLSTAAFAHGGDPQAKGPVSIRTVGEVNRATATDQGDATNRPSSKVPFTRKALWALSQRDRSFLPFDLDVPGQSYVSTGPYIGVPIQYAGSELIVNSPSINNDLQLLNIRKSIHKELMTMGGTVYEEPYHSHLVLSGIIEGQVLYHHAGEGPSYSDIDVTNISLDALVLGPSDWILGYIEFSYFNPPPISDVFVSNNQYRVSDSRVAVNKGFITLGNLSKSPFYFTLGQYYVPFGTYSSTIVSDTLPKLLGRTKARAFQIGLMPQFDNTGYAAIYVFRGDTYTHSAPKIANGGINLGYKFTCRNISANFGGGLIANIADSGGMQLGNNFASFERIHRRVRAYNLRALVDIGKHLDIIAEYVGATSHFNPLDMSFNARGAKPSAMDLQVAYSFEILDGRPSSIGLAYDRSKEALGIGIPRTRFAGVLNTSLLRNTLQSLEIRRDKNYFHKDLANGPVGAAPFPGACTAAVCNTEGKTDWQITAQFDYYF